MKRMELLCSSPSSTAICSSLDHRSMVRHSTTTTSSSKQQPIFGTCSSQDFFPINPNNQRRSTSVMLSDLYKNPSSVSDKQKQSNFDSRRRSSADAGDLLFQLRRRQLRHIRSGSSAHLLSSDDRTGAPYLDRVSDSVLVPISDHNRQCPNRLKETSSVGGDALVPERGHRYSSSSALALSGDQVPDSGQFSGAVVGTARHSSLKRSESGDLMTSDEHVVVPAQASTPRPRRVSFQDGPPVLKSSSSARCRDQVVVLRVSIHCKGCEGKVRKHISKMEGVTWFSIDLASKQVIVKGDVTPLGVLASISKVKAAQLWPSLLQPTSTSAPLPPAAAAAPRWST